MTIHIQMLQDIATHARAMADAMQAIVDDCAEQLAKRKAAGESEESIMNEPFQQSGMTPYDGPTPFDEKTPAAPSTPPAPEKPKLTIVELRAFVAERSTPKNRTKITDSNGNEVETFIYNGNVYLPLPAVAEAMGVGYSWDGSTMSAYLGAQPGESQYLLDVCPPYQTGGVNLFTSSEGSSFEMAGQSYTNGLKFRNTGNDKFVLFNLNGQYSKLKFTLGHVDGESMEDVTLQIYLDGKLTGEYLIPAEGLPQEYTLDLKNALSMKNSGKGWLHYSGMAEITVE